jgi:xylose isomerase
MKIVTGNKQFFKEVSAIKYEGPETDNPFAFIWYNAEQVVAGKPMKDWLRFACAYWHSFVGNGADPFGEPTHLYAWNTHTDPIARAKEKMDAAFEFITKMNIPFYCFHDVDVVDFTIDISENEKRLFTIVEYAQQKQKDSGVKLLWGTAILFSHRKFMNGAATNPDFLVLTHAAAQVKTAIDATIALNGANYVFWGGREGYMSLLNTNMKREKEHLDPFLHTAKDYARRNGFKGNFFVEPKPCEPTKHQNDYDSETGIGYLRQYDLLNDFKLKIEVNHATLAGHTFQHELQVAADAGVLGSMDATRGDYQNGWDTDEFPNNINELTEAMLVIMGAGGFQGGGINFDTKRRRNSTDNLDLFYAHIGGMDTFGRAFVVADKILNQSEYKKLRTQRYSSYDSGESKLFEEGKLTLEDLRNYAANHGEPNVVSGKQEYFENIINRYI